LIKVSGIVTAIIQD